MFKSFSNAKTRDYFIYISLKMRRELVKLLGCGDLFTRRFVYPKNTLRPVALLKVCKQHHTERASAPSLEAASQL